MMGGDVILSYPVVGPDDFVVEALREQVRRHEAKRKRVSSGLLICAGLAEGQLGW
jgi:hypothetical protein